MNTKNEGEHWVPRTQASFSGGPPRPPKVTARHLEDQPDDPDKIIYPVEPIAVSDLARLLHLKPFKVVADLLEMRLFKTSEGTIDFETAAVVASKHGFRAQRPPPGMLVL